MADETNTEAQVAAPEAAPQDGNTGFGGPGAGGNRPGGPRGGRGRGGPNGQQHPGHERRSVHRVVFDGQQLTVVAQQHFLVRHQTG